MPGAGASLRWCRHRPANLNKVAGHDDELIQLVCVAGEHVVQSSDDDLQRGKRTEAQQDHTGMRLTLYEDEVTKVSIVGDKRALFPVSDSEDIGIRQARRMIMDDSGDVVTLILEIRDDAPIGALVQQKSHALEVANSALALAAAKASFLGFERR